MASWFRSLYDAVTNILHAEGQDFLIHELTSTHGVAEAAVPLVKDQDYVTIRVKKSRIVNVRKGTSKFYGSVQSRAHYIHADRGQVEYQRVLAPEMLELDADNVDHMLVIDKPVLGPVPYLGELALELGLFSVKSSDLAAPYLELLNNLAEKSGVAALTTALPYVEPLRKGADLLFGNAKLSTLEIGVDRSWPALSTGTWLVMRAPAQDINPNRIRINPSDGTVTTGAPKPCPYLVFTIEASRRRDDWMTIPELKSAWDAIATAAKAGRVNDAEQLMKQFVLIARWSPDLVPDDARRLADRAAALLPSAIQPRTTVAAKPSAVAFPELKSLDLYGP